MTKSKSKWEEELNEDFPKLYAVTQWFTPTGWIVMIAIVVFLIFIANWNAIIGFCFGIILGRYHGAFVDKHLDKLKKTIITKEENNGSTTEKTP